MAGRKANSAYMLIGQVFSKAGLLVSMMIFSRILEDGAFGELLLSVSIGFITFFLSDMGVTMLVTRKMSGGEPVSMVLSTALSIRTVLSIISIALITAAVVLAGYSSRQVLLVITVSSGFILGGYCESVFAFFRAREQMIYEGVARILHGLLGIGIALFAWYTRKGVVFAGFVYILREIPVLVLVSAVALTRLGYRPVFKQEIIHRMKPLFKEALPLGLAGIVIVAGQRLDGVFIKEYLGDAAIAAYQQCLKIFEALVLVVTPTLLPGALFPALCVAVKNGWGEARMRIAWMTELFLVIAFSFVIPLWSGEFFVLNTIWGDGFLRGVSPEDLRWTYRIVLLTLPVAYIFHMFLTTVIATARQRKIFPAVSIALIAEGLLFAVLIPAYGLKGAAAAHAVFLTIAVFWMAMDLHAEYGPTGFIRGALRPVLSFLPALAVLLAGPFPGVFNGFAAFAVFATCWIVSGGLSVMPSAGSAK